MDEAICNGHLRIAGAFRVVHGLQEEMLKVELFELLGPRARLRKHQL